MYPYPLKIYYKNTYNFIKKTLQICYTPTKHIQYVVVRHKISLNRGYIIPPSGKSGINRVYMSITSLSGNGGVKAKFI